MTVPPTIPEKFCDEYTRKDTRIEVIHQKTQDCLRLEIAG